MIRSIFLGITIMSLMGCISTDGTPSSTAAIDCVAVDNIGGPCVPNLSGVAIKIPGVTIINSGPVSRAQSISVSLAASNGSGINWTGYYKMAFDAGCNGAATWEIVPLQATPSLAPGEAWNTGVGGSCGDMPLGARTLTATLYEADAVTIADQVQVQFNLTE